VAACQQLRSLQLPLASADSKFNMLAFIDAAQAKLVLRLVLGASSDPDALYALAGQGTATAEEVSGTAYV